MNSILLKDIAGRVIVIGKPSTISQQLRAVAALADPRQDVDATAPHYVRGLSQEAAK